VVRLRSSPWFSPATVLCRDFSSTLTTMAFDHSSLRWFEAYSCKSASGGQSPIFCATSWRTSGRPEEFHLQSPTDPYVNLSIHTAPASLTLGTSQSQADARSKTAPPSFLVGCHSLQAGSSPSLQPITEISSLLRAAPSPFLASVLSSAWGLHLNFSLCIETTGCWVDQPLPAFTPADPIVRLSRNGLLPRVTRGQLRISLQV